MPAPNICKYNSSFAAVEQSFSSACQDPLGAFEKYVCRALYSEVI